MTTERTSAAPVYSFVIPILDEEETLHELYRRVASVMDQMDGPCEMVLIDDGSSDSSFAIITELERCDARGRALRLSRNFGHQVAITAGLDHARGRAVVVMDGDLQDPPELIPQLHRLWRDGHEVVYAVRQHRKEGPIKRLGYHAFYRILNAISDIDIPLDSGDFCLMDRKVVDALN